MPAILIFLWNTGDNIMKYHIRSKSGTPLMSAAVPPPCDSPCTLVSKCVCHSPQRKWPYLPRLTHKNWKNINTNKQGNRVNHCIHLLEQSVKYLRYRISYLPPTRCFAAVHTNLCSNISAQYVFWCSTEHSALLDYKSTHGEISLSCGFAQKDRDWGPSKVP